MPDVYARLGVRPIINARGTHTRLGGTLIRPEVLDAMREAASAYVVLDELQDKASEVIAPLARKSSTSATAARRCPTSFVRPSMSVQR